MKKSLKTRLTLNRETLATSPPRRCRGSRGSAGASSGGCPDLHHQPLCDPHTCPSQCGQWYCYGV